MLWQPGWWEEVRGWRGGKGRHAGCRGFEGGVGAGGGAESVLGTSRCPHGEAGKGLGGGQKPPRAEVSEGGSGGG